MEIDIETILVMGSAIITGASIALKAIAPLTENKTDDKILYWLLKILKVLSLHHSDNGKLEVSVKAQK